MDSLEIKNLTVSYKNSEFNACEDINIKLEKGDSLGVIGESGSGKTTLAMSIMGLLNDKADISGEILYNGVDLLKLSKKEINKIRWKEIAVVFQNSLDVLNPVLTINEQIEEVLIRHTSLDKKQRNIRIVSVLEKVKLSKDVVSMYPHELSGGMRQKLLLAMAISCNPKLLIVDEPTSALDVISKVEILKLLKEIKSTGISLLVISHELDTISYLTEKINVMYMSSIVEKGLTKEVLLDPKHTYTRGLINSSPEVNPFGDMWGIPGDGLIRKNDSCPFYNRCIQRLELCENNKPKLEKIGDNRYVSCNQGGIKTLLEVKGICKNYGDNIGCIDCNINVDVGEVVSIIGQSGSGKTTLANIISGMLNRDKGEVLFNGKKVIENNFTSKKGGIQIVFQDPYSSLNKRLSVYDVVVEPLEIINDSDRINKVKEILNLVYLPSDGEFLKRKCSTLSGGQRQRLAIARALVMEPKLLIADEITSMLDLSTQANILRLLKEIQNKKGFSMIYITHDLFVARKISDKIYVMKDGRIVECGPVRGIFDSPKEDYTKDLIKCGNLV